MRIKPLNQSYWKYITFPLILLVVFLLGFSLGIIGVQKKFLNLTTSQFVSHSITAHIIALTDKQSIADNSFSQAIEVKSGYEVQSNLFSGNNSDYYYFQVDEPSDVRISYKDLPYSYSTYIYSPDKKVIASTQRTGFIASAGVLKIATPGKYYIQIATDKPSKKKFPYSVTVTILPIFNPSN